MKTLTHHSYHVTRHYYSDSMRVEQSLDVYQPDNNNNSSSIEEEEDRPVIVLVMGSGWLGHAWWIYAGTNWWNAGGPQTICGTLGYTCVSIRHGGAFLSQGAMVLVSSVAAAMFLHAIEDATVVMALLLSLMIFAFLYWQGRGAATLEDMVQDVADALQFVQTNSGDVLGIQNNKNNNPRKLVLGGYSSGAHVVATFVSQRQNESRSTTKNNSTILVGILHLSGVLSLQSCRAMNMVTLVVFGKWACQMPSPLGSHPPPPPLRHLVVGCHHEVFGIPFLDGTFCAQRYHHWLSRDLGIDARCVLVESNHWSVLSSHALSRALEEHLPWFTSTTTARPPAKTMAVGRQETTDTSESSSLPGLVFSTHCSVEEGEF